MVRTGLAMLFVLLVAAQSHGGELEQRSDLELRTAAMFYRQQFADMERVSRDFRENETRSPSGIWNLTSFYGGIEQAANTVDTDEQRWSGLENRSMNWMTLFPKSPTAINAHAIVLIRHGMAYRGEGWASKVKDENWKPFREYVAKAREHLLAHKQIAAPDPRWYETMLVVAKLDGWPPSQFQALVDEAVTKHPYFYQIYFAAIDYLTPKWHGDKRKIEDFANFAVKKTNAREQTGMYARIYWYASQVQYGTLLFTDSAVVWPRMKQGIDDVLRHYPDQWNINNFAQFACQAGDRVKTEQLINRIETPMPEVWLSRQNASPHARPLEFGACKNWTMSRRETTWR